MRYDDFPDNASDFSTLTVSGNDFSARYLAAKKAVDDRALNRQVWGTLRRILPQPTGRRPVGILEIGAGIGTMLARVVDWGLLAGAATYVLTDCADDHLRQGREYLTRWAQRQGHDLSWRDPRHGRLCTANAVVSLVLAVAGAEAIAHGSEPSAPLHHLIAHAVLDLVDFPILLPQLLARLERRGLAYLTCNFDGGNLFLPEYQGQEEKEILARYHASIDLRLPGASRTGRRRLTFLQRPSLELLAAGGSDWLIHPHNGSYTSDESFFLHTIIAMVKQELVAGKGPPPPGLNAWAGFRHRQVEAGEVTFIARHLDFITRRRRSLP